MDIPWYHYLANLLLIICMSIGSSLIIERLPSFTNFCAADSVQRYQFNFLVAALHVI